MNARKYEFSWKLIGLNAAAARPVLGEYTRVEVHRLYMFTLRDALEECFGAEQADSVFRRAGVIAGRALYEQYCKNCTDVAMLLSHIEEKFRELGIGIFRVEDENLDNWSFTITVNEDLDCAGLPDTQDHICVYDEGLLQGIFEAFTGKAFIVKEIDCWCAGGRTCRFRVSAVE